MPRRPFKSLPERKTPKIPGVLDRIDIDTAIGDSAQANATGILANGLISASHGIADSVQSLVKAANKATGNPDKEELVENIN